MSIHKQGDKWVVTDRSGKKILGRHPSKKKALAQLRAIEASKHSGRSRVTKKAGKRRR